jgi:hypothetical protein
MKSVGRSSAADGFADKFAVPFNRVTLKGRPLEMDVEMDFRLSEWPTNRVASTENLDIGYSGLTLSQLRNSRWKRHARIARNSGIPSVCARADLTKLDNSCVKHGFQT